MTKQIKLTPIFLTDITDRVISFIKPPSSGTGLGKTFSAKDSAIAFFKYCRLIGSLKTQISIFTAPQHNQITLDKKGFGKDAEFIKVRPVSRSTLSDIESDGNAYNIARSLFFTSDDKKTALYDQLRLAAQASDNASGNDSLTPESAVSLEKKLNGIIYGVYSIKRELDKGLTDNASADFMDEIEATVQKQEVEDQIKNSKQKIKSNTEKIAKYLVDLSEKSYSNNVFADKIKHHLTAVAFNKFREITASFFPFLHAQLSEKRFFFLCMTTKKMMTEMKVFVPKYKTRTKTVKWTVQAHRIADVVTDKGVLGQQLSECMSELQTDPDLPDDQREKLKASPKWKLYNTEFTFYMDESDEAKSIIAQDLSEKMYDQNLIQVIGALAKETGDVLACDGYVYLSDLMAKDPEKSIAETLYDLRNDDSLHRIIAKESLRRVREKAYKALHESHWPYAKTYKSHSEMMEKVDRFFRNSLTAPYCTVDKEVDSNIFQSTSAFSGEMYGFLGSRSLDGLFVVNLGNSFRIVSEKRKGQYPGDSVLPMALFLLMISESYLYFRFIGKGIGSSKSEIGQLEVERKIIAEDDKEALDKLMREFDKKSSAFAGVSAPFRSDHGENLHTQVSEKTINSVSKITHKKFTQAFSDIHGLTEILDPESILATPSEVPVDIHYAYEKGHTIYGMSETVIKHYPIYGESSHVVFPVSFRVKSPEAFIADLVDNDKRVNRVFLLSATGGFENNHISAFSLEAFRMLLKNKNAEFVEMSDEDFDLTQQKQSERAAFKDITIKDLEFDGKGPFQAATWSILGEVFQEDIDGNCQDNNFKKSLLRNKYKKKELNNFLGVLDSVIADRLECKSGSNAFALSLMQSQSNAINAFKHLSRVSDERNQLPIKGASCRVDRLFVGGKNTSEDAEGWDSGANYGAFVISGHFGDYNKYNNSVSKTLVVFYSANFDKAAARLLKEKTWNKKCFAYKFKKALGLSPDKEVKGVDDPDFNVMNYILSDQHGMSVVIASAFQSAARGLNLIVNQESSTSNIRKSRSKRKTPTGNEKGEIVSADSSPRDLDALFYCAPPYYSHIQRNSYVGDVLSPRSAQNRFFDQCSLYHYHLEYVARNNERNAHLPPVLNTEIELDSHLDEDKKDVGNYFGRQHEIALLSVLMQGNGRIERTNFKQSQSIYFCEGSREVLINGIKAVTHGHSDQQIERMIGAMSVANATVVRQIMASLAHQKTENKEMDSIEVQGKCQWSVVSVFEEMKTLMLSWIRNYREGVKDDPDYPSEMIEFYESLRSPLIWTHGQQAYINNLYAKAEPLPARAKLKMHAFIDTLFFESPHRLARYEVESKNIEGRSSRVFSPSGTVLDLNASYKAKKERAKDLIVNPYEEKVGECYRYPAPWFLGDIDGNYGELEVDGAVEHIVKNDDAVNVLDRTNSLQAAAAYEYADVYLVKGDTLLAIDAKCLTAWAYFNAGNGQSRSINVRLWKKLEAHRKEIEALFPSMKVKLVAVNTIASESSLSHVKAVPGIKNVYTMGAGNSRFETVINLKKILKQGEAE